MRADLDPRTQARLGRALWSARLVMLWEQGAKVWAPWLLAVAAVITAALWGLFDPLTPGLRLALIGAIVLVAAIASARGALSIRWPGREAARTRLETDSALVHAPLAVLEDSPAAGDMRLWALHRQAAVQAVAQAKVGRPRAGLAAADPMALRYALLVAALLAVWARGPERVRQVASLAEAPEQMAAIDHGLTSIRLQAVEVQRTMTDWFTAKTGSHASGRTGAGQH